MPLPAGAVAKLAEGRRRAAKLHDCPRCDAPILTGEDHDRCAHVATVDLEPVDPVGEMLAHLDGRHTYTLRAGDLFHREQETVNTGRCRDGETVHATHVCRKDTLF